MQRTIAVTTSHGTTTSGPANWSAGQSSVKRKAPEYATIQAELARIAKLGVQTAFEDDFQINAFQE